MGFKTLLHCFVSHDSCIYRQQPGNTEIQKHKVISVKCKCLKKHSRASEALNIFLNEFQYHHPYGTELFPLYFNVCSCLCFGWLGYLKFHVLETNKQTKSHISGFVGEAWQLSGARRRSENWLRITPPPDAGGGVPARSAVGGQQARQGPVPNGLGIFSLRFRKAVAAMGLGCNWMFPGGE